MAKQAKKKASCAQDNGRTEKGRFQKGVSGNPAGGRPGKWRNELEEAIEIVQTRKRKKFMIHAIEQAYIDTKVLVAVLKKLLPDLKIEEIDLNAGENLKSFIDWLTGRNGDDSKGGQDV